MAAEVPFTGRLSSRENTLSGMLTSRDLLRSVVENSLEALAIVNAGDSSIVYANPKFEKLFGYDFGELLGKDVRILHERQSQADAEMIQETLHTVGAWSGNIHNLRKDGSTFWSHAKISTYSNPQFGTVWIAAHEDLSGHQRTQETLRQSEERFRWLFEQSSLGMALCDRNLTFLKVNGAFCSMLGYAEDEILKLTFKDITHPEHSFRDSEALAYLFCGKTRTYQAEKRFVTKSGETVWATLRISVLRDAQGAYDDCLVIIENINERKRAEEALRRSEAALRKAQQVAHVGSWEWNIKTNHLEWSDEMYRIFGVEKEKVSGNLFEIITRSIHPDDRLVVERSHVSVILNKTPLPVECRIIRPDSTIRTVYAEAGELTFDDSGKPDQLTGTVLDITERKKAETTVLEALELNLQVISSSQLGIIIYDVQSGLCILANEAAARIVGSTPEVLQTQNFRELQSWKNSGILQAAEEVISTGDSTRKVFHLTSTFGRAVWMDNLLSCFTSNRRRHLLFMCEDITERRNAEESLLEERERLAVTLRSIGDAVISTDTAGHIILMNRVAEELTGWTLEEASGKALGDVFRIVNELTRENCESPVERVLATGGVINLENHTILVARSGRERVIADSGAPIKDREGKTIGVVLVFRDNSEKLRTQEIMVKTQKLEALSVLAAGIAHDFNNLLTGIFGFIDLATAKSKDREVSEHLGDALGAMNRARGLTHQLLTFAKGGAPVKKTSAVLPFVKQAVQFALSGSNVYSSYDTPADLWMCEFDPDQMGQVIDNIIINAQQAMPAGGSIRISAVNMVLIENEHPTLHGGRYVRISIADTGIGIARETLPRIFDPFFTTKPTGSGLGLATSYSIVKRHDGCIEVDSEPGKGSVFHVYLPALTDVQTPAMEHHRKTHKGSGRILLMDDEEMIRLTVGALLTAFGYSVETAREGAEAIRLFSSAKAQGKPFRAVIVDLTVRGGMGGKETAVEIRKIDSETPLFVASGYADDPVIARPGEYGFTAGIGKPFHHTELSEMLEKYITDPCAGP